MKDLESVFIKEFKESTRITGASKDIYSVPLPEECKGWEVSGTEEFLLKNVENEDFKLLNGTVVKKLPKGYEAKQRVIDKVTRKFKTDENDKYIYTDVKVPSGSMVVISNKSIKLPYSYWVKPSSDGYGYVDYKMGISGVEYLYIVPKANLFKVHQTALVISVKNMKNFSGMGFTTWSNGTIYMHVIPYRSTNSYIGSRVLKTGIGLNYQEEINRVLAFWQEQGYIPNIQLSATSDGNNLATKETVVGYDEGEYIPVEQLAITDKEIYGEDEE